MQRRFSPVLVVLALLAGLLLVGPTATAAKPRKVKVTASASVSKAKVGTTVKIKGKVTGRSARAKVVLLKKARTRWVVVTSAKVNAKKRYVLKTKVAKGTTTYRVKVRKNKRVKAAASRTLRVRGTSKSTTSRSAYVSATEQAAVEAILAETNAFRAANGKPALKLSTEMTAVARNWSQRMADTGEFKHNPNYSRQIPSGWTRAAENIAAGQSLSGVVRAWINSPGHRANLLGDFTHLGVGYVSKSGSRYTRYYTQVFAKYSSTAAPRPTATPTPTRTPTPTATPSTSPEQAAINQILAETNAFRAANGKPALKLSAPMTTVARNWSQTMADTGAFNHNPNYSRQIPTGWTRAGENIAAGYSLNAVVQGWINSPGHRANMLGDFTHIGIGYVSKPGTRYTHYYTQVFAKY